MKLREIDALKQRLDALRPLSPEVVRTLRDELILNWTYHSNAIEGNTLTLLETKVVLEGITVGGKLLREHIEVVNHRDAMHYVEDLAHKAEPLSEWQIRNLHRLVLKQIDDANAGVYRRVNVETAGARHTPPHMLQVLVHMADLIRWYEEETARLHPVLKAIQLHTDFLKIHPFIDGNGRTARLLLNLELLKAGYPPIVLPVQRRLEYFGAIDAALMNGDTAPFVDLVADCMREAFARYSRLLDI
jgi:Fic family protein